MFSYEVVASFNDLENAIYTTILENENISSMTIKELAQLDMYQLEPYNDFASI
ncbi:hypothetical protein [Streptococcus pseudopneumoniae]|uniref:hypothetical protein n=1 Tax=Streptococcus pseudopneumoniae TaxID=257758 RepID=UPI0002E68A27|nr:hypothetical protein [Streptococcus pseudopneumoniae]